MKSYLIFYITNYILLSLVIDEFITSSDTIKMKGDSLTLNH